MDSIQKTIGNEILNFAKIIEKESKIENQLLENIIIKKTQINYKVRNLIKSPSKIKNFIKLFTKMYEEIIIFFNRSIKIIKKQPIIQNQFIQIINILKYYDKYNNNITFIINYPNKGIKLEEQTQKNLNSLYLKFMKKYEISNKELINRFKYFYDSYKTIFEHLKQLSTKIKDYITEFENTGDSIGEITDLQEDDQRFSPIEKTIYNIFISIVESFFKFDELFLEIDKKKECWKKEKLFNTLKEIQIKINTELDKFKPSFQEIENYFPKMNIDIKGLNDIENELLKYMNNLREFKIEGSSQLINENIMREDILIILDTTNSMGKYLEILKEKLQSVIDQIKQNCPLAIIYLGFIGYKDFCDLELGDEYVDLELTLNYEKIYNKIKNIEVDGGCDIPEDVAGAFEMALNKKWGEGYKIAFLITDAPCHGIEYHDLDQNKENYRDNYPEGYYDGDNIDDEEFRRREIHLLVKELAHKNIALACLNILDLTDKMFLKFRDLYEKEQKRELFFVEKNDLDKFIIIKATELFKQKEKEIIDSLKIIVQNVKK